MEVSDVPPPLRDRLGLEATSGLLELLETARQEWVADVSTAAVERFERRLTGETGAIRLEMGQLRLEMREGFAAVRQEMAAEFAAVRQEMAAQFAAVRQETAAEFAAVRQEFAAVRQEFGDLRHGTAAGFASLRQETLTGLAALRQETADGRFELLKWCFLFWVGQVFAVAGVMAVLLRLMRP